MNKKSFLTFFYVNVLDGQYILNKRLQGQLFFGLICTIESFTVRQKANTVSFDLKYKQITVQ